MVYRRIGLVFVSASQHGKGQGHGQQALRDTADVENGWLMLHRVILVLQDTQIHGIKIARQ
jgi:hypothetical protein